MKIKKYNFTPDWFSGFTQSDGSFIVSFETKQKGIPIRPRPIFNLTQSIDELEMFIALQEYLKIGLIQKNRNNVTLVITSINDILTILVPLFDKHLL
jgi:hypothetical protein